MADDTWTQLQAHKRQQDNLRERLLQRRKERQTAGLVPVPEQKKEDTKDPSAAAVKKEDVSFIKTEVKSEPEQKPAITIPVSPLEIDIKLERITAQLFCSKELSLPITLQDLVARVSKKISPHATVKLSSVRAILEKLDAQKLLTLKKGADGVLTVVDCDSKLEAVYGEQKKDGVATTDSMKRPHEPGPGDSPVSSKKEKLEKVDTPTDEVLDLLAMPTTKEFENKKLGEEILDLLNQPTAKEQSLLEKFKSARGTNLQEFCQYGTRKECKNHKKDRCKKVYFKKIIQSHTDESLGDCSFLNTCFHMDTCKYVHYEVDKRDKEKSELRAAPKNISNPDGSSIRLTPPQWISCDVRYLDFDVLGKFSVVMADPPWDIHMELPYGTMADHEMRNMAVQKLQNHGYIFLWVTGRAIELGRECLAHWGYKRVDELIWVKTNQLQRLIRTGRTGHWINHGKEHCIIGVKGNPSTTLFNRGLDCDVLVSEVRDTSHKPDEVYGMIERLAPGQRKIELFGRQHNVQPNWMTLGNQLNGVNLCESEVINRWFMLLWENIEIGFKEKYPDGVCSKPTPKAVPTVIELTSGGGS